MRESTVHGAILRGSTLVVPSLSRFDIPAIHRMSCSPLVGLLSCLFWLVKGVGFCGFDILNAHAIPLMLGSEFKMKLWKHPSLSRRMTAAALGVEAPIWLLGHIEGDVLSSRVQLMLSRTSATGWIKLASGSQVHFNATRVDDVPLTLSAMPQRSSVLRHRRGARIDTNRVMSPQRCTVAIDTDDTFLAQWGGGGSAAEMAARVRAKVLEVMHAVDGVLSDPENFGDALGIQVASIDVHSEVLFRSSTDDLPDRPANNLVDNAFSAYKEWLAYTVADGAVVHNRSIRADEVCLNLLFVHRSFNGPLGASTIGSEAKGACSQTPQVINDIAQSTNALVVTSNHYGTPVSLPTLVHTTVHEVGHGWGAYHTCCSNGSDCTAGIPCSETRATLCHPRGEKFVMHPILGQESISLLFSSCSRSSISALLDHNPECLRSSECAFGGTCCASRRHVHRRGTLCRAPDPAKTCGRPMYCDGVSAECPIGIEYAADGTACHLEIFSSKSTSATSTLGVCLNTSCSVAHHGYCSTRGMHGCSTTESCLIACRATDGQCQPTQQWAAAGYPCSADGVRGLCTAEGECNTGAGTDLVVNLVMPIAVDCQWETAVWGRCNVSCGGGKAILNYECRCAGGGIDESGRLCRSEPLPRLPIKSCNEQSCGTCTVLTVQSSEDTVQGSYTLMQRATDVEGPVFYSEATRLYMYQVFAGGTMWWGVGPYSRTTYRWVTFVQSTLPLPPTGASDWRLFSSYSAVANMDIQCACTHTDTSLCTVTSTSTTVTSTTSLALFSTSSLEPSMSP